MTLYPTCSFYVLSFLANLNARHYVRGEGGSITISNIEFMNPTIGFAARDSDTTASRPSQAGIKLRRLGESSARVVSSEGDISVRISYLRLSDYASLLNLEKSAGLAVVNKGIRITGDNGSALRADMVFKEVEAEDSVV